MNNQIRPELYPVVKGDGLLCSNMFFLGYLLNVQTQIVHAKIFGAMLLNRVAYVSFIQKLSTSSDLV